MKKLLGCNFRMQFPCQILKKKCLNVQIILMLVLFGRLIQSWASVFFRGKQEKVPKVSKWTPEGFHLKTGLIPIRLICFLYDY